MTTIFLSCVIALSSLGINVAFFVANSESSEVEYYFGHVVRSDADTEPNDILLEANQLNLLVGNNTYLFGNFSPSDTIDWYKFDVSSGDKNGNNADKFYFSLTDNSTVSGVYMELYAPLPWPHKLVTSTKNFNGIPSQDPALIELVAPLNGTFYLKIIPNSTPNQSQERYVLSYGIIKEPTNAAFDNDNSFDSELVKWVDPNSETVAINEYLSATNDIHDFFNFTGYKNQTLEITLTPPIDGDFDLFLYDSKSIDPISSSENTGLGENGEEYISIILPENNIYYIRVLARINGSTPDMVEMNRGFYDMIFNSNVPPLWRETVKTSYIIPEDSKPVYLEPEKIWKDINKQDKIGYLLWNHTTNDWDPRDNNDQIISSIEFEDFKVQLINNETPKHPNEVIKITTKLNKFGNSSIKLGAYDKPAGAFSEQNISINIIPINDKPIINSTHSWKDLAKNAVIDDKRITIFEFNTAQIKVDAYDIEGDSLKFSAEFLEDYNSTAFAKEFKINPDSGVIYFYANYTFIGNYFINIIVTDSGKNPDQQMAVKQIAVRISSFDIDRNPKTFLKAPGNGSIVKSLKPTLTWNVTDFDTPIYKISYKVYLSTDISKILTRSDDALLYHVKNQTCVIINEKLADGTRYYWTVIPNDGIFTGSCGDGYHIFKTDSALLGPRVNLISPLNKIILNFTNIELNWSIQPDYDSPVESDIYIGEDPFKLRFVKQVTTTNFFPEGLKNEKTYYWQIIPRVHINSALTEGSKSPIWTFTIQRSYNSPSVYLTSPRDLSILKNNYLTLTWELQYDSDDYDDHYDHDQIEYKVYLSTSKNVWSDPFRIISGQTYCKVTELDHTTYFWKVVPYLNEIPGYQSEIWSFRIYPKVVQPIAIPLTPVNNATLTSMVVEFKWTIDYSGSVAKVKYDIYLDNLTNDPATMTLYKKDYRQLYIRTDLRNLETYYWRVVPTIVIEEGIVVGEFKGQSEVHSFSINTNYNPSPIRKFNLSIQPTFFELSAGNSTEAILKIFNEGNVELSFNITYQIEPNDKIVVNTEFERIVLSAGEEREIKIEIDVPNNIKGNVYVITIDCEADNIRINKKEILTLEITNNEDDMSEQPSIDINILLAAVIIIIIFLIIIAFIKRRRKINTTNIAEPGINEIIKKDANIDNGRVSKPDSASSSDSKQSKFAPTTNSNENTNKSVESSTMQTSSPGDEKQVETIKNAEIGDRDQLENSNVNPNNPKQESPIDLETLESNLDSLINSNENIQLREQNKQVSIVMLKSMSDHQSANSTQQALAKPVLANINTNVFVNDSTNESLQPRTQNRIITDNLKKPNSNTYEENTLQSSTPIAKPVKPVNNNIFNS